MNESPTIVRQHESSPPRGDLPVSQLPESIAFGVGSLYMAYVCATNIVDVAQNGLSDGTAWGGASTAVTAVFTGYTAVKAHRETVAYKNSTAEQRDSLDVIRRNQFVRGMRTFSWGAGTFILGEVGVIEAVKTAEGGSNPEALARIGAIAACGLAATKTVSGFRKSMKKQKDLKELAASKKVPETFPETFREFTLVSASYRAQLHDLADTLVTPERFKK